MPPTGGPEGTLAGVAHWVGETETSFRESVPRHRKETHVRDIDHRAAGPSVPTPNLTCFHEVDKGGHFAAWKQPELFSEELWVAFRSLR
jgi:hypothetical protein